jgi:hypothetical protein
MSISFFKGKKSMGRIFIVVIAVLILISSTVRAAIEPVVQCNPEPTNMLIAYGDIVTCSTEAVGDADTFRFSGSMGESIQIELLGTKSFGLGLSVSDPNGIVIVSGGTNNGAYLPIRGLKLEKTGTYTIVITGHGGVATGEDYTFFVERGTPPPSSVLAVKYREPIIGELNPIGDVDALSFQANAGDVITVSTEGVAHSTNINLYAPDGTLTVGVFIGELNQTGTYTLLIGSLVFKQVGEYTITIFCNAGPCEEPPPPGPCDDFTPWTRRHIDRTNPQAEGWTANKGNGGGVTVGPLNDNGLRAWYVDDNSVNLGSLFTYEQVPHECEIPLGSTTGWTLRTRLRVVDINSLPSFAVFVSYQDGTHEWPITFGADVGGNPLVRLPTGTGAGTGIDYMVTGGPNAYHLYALVFDPSNGKADLFVDGIEVLSDYEGRSEGQTPLVYWGGGQSDTTGQGNYNLVEFFVGEEVKSPVGGSVTGVTLRNVLCRNVNTGLEVVIPDAMTSWDCEDAGLAVNPGDRVNMTIRSIVD